MLREALEDIAKWLKLKLTEELEKQGHVATSDLLSSIDVAVEDITGGFDIRGSYLHYGRYVDTGRAPGVTKVPISALIDWIRVKKIDLRGNSEKQVAFAIQTAIYNKGIPTDGDDGKLRWMSGTLEANETELDEMIREAAGFYVTSVFNNMIEESQKVFDQMEAA